MMTLATRPSRTATTRAGAVLLALALATAGCSSSDSSDESATGQQQGRADESTSPVGATIAGPPDASPVTPGGQVSMAIEAEPEQLDPTRYAFSSSGHFVASAVYDPLATIDENGLAVPYLAESIEPNDDATVWTITLPEGVTFHDGSPLTADAVATNLEAAKASIISGTAASIMTDIEVLDTLRLEVTLRTAWHSFPALLTSQVGYIVEPTALEAGTAGTDPVGTGPFEFNAHIPGESWSFNKNPNYWRTDDDGNQLPYLDELRFLPQPDDPARLADLESGRVDMIHTVSPAQVNALKRSDFKRVFYDLGEENFVVLNMEAAPFDNPIARRAVVMATDVDRYLDEIGQGTVRKANSAFAEGQLGYVEDNGYPEYDMEEAKRLVAQYEAETGEPLAFTFVTVDEPRNMRNAQFLEALFEEAGMQVDVEGVLQIQLVARVATGGYQMSVFRNFGSINPDTETPFWRASSVREEGASLNFPRYTNPRLDELIDEALGSTDEGERDALYQELNRLWAEDLPYLWLGRFEWALAAWPRVNGIYAAGNGSLQTLGNKTWLAELWVER